MVRAVRSAMVAAGRRGKRSRVRQYRSTEVTEGLRAGRARARSVAVTAPRKSLDDGEERGEDSRLLASHVLSSFSLGRLSSSSTSLSLSRTLLLHHSHLNPFASPSCPTFSSKATPSTTPRSTRSLRLSTSRTSIAALLHLTITI